MGWLVDVLTPRGEVLTLTLKRKGVPVAAIYSDGKREVRSPSLLKDKTDVPARKD